MKLTEKLYDKMLASCRGGFFVLTWGVCDANGEPLGRDVPLKAGMFIVAENYYGDVVLHVNDDMSLTTCEVEYEDLPVYMPTIEEN